MLLLSVTTAISVAVCQHNETFQLLQLNIVHAGQTLICAGCRRVAKSTGASVVTTLADMDGKESFDASSLGQADEVITNVQDVPETTVWHAASAIITARLPFQF